MTDRPAGLDDQIDDALEQVITAAREHLAAVKAADGAVDDEQVWRSYVALNNASFGYDQLLLDSYGEVTPWDTEAIDLEGKPRVLTAPGAPIGETAKDPYPSVLSVRQRRDYRVPSVAALLAAASDAAQRLAPDEPVPAPRTVGDAVLELVRDGDGTLDGLDVPELEPLAGVVAVVEVARSLAETAPGTETVPAPGEPVEHLPPDPVETAAAFQLGAGDRLLARLDEQPYVTEEAVGPPVTDPRQAGPRETDQ
jgi:hypothetical protein